MIVGAGLAARVSGLAPRREKPVQPALSEFRRSASDLELTGYLATRSAVRPLYLTSQELGRMPQVQFLIDDDPDLPGVSMRVAGVELRSLLRILADGKADLIDVTCTDGYRSYYPIEMIAAHDPVLVLTIDGAEPRTWAARTRHEDPGPYLILYDRFRPGWRVLSHVDRPQLPTNAVRIAFDTQADAFAPIRPSATELKSTAVQAGYRIAQQNCIRCHASGGTGGSKSSRTWEQLGTDARDRPDWFVRFVKEPTSVSAGVSMPANREYDGATLAALTAYFQLFAEKR